MQAEASAATPKEEENAKPERKTKRCPNYVLCEGIIWARNINDNSCRECCSKFGRERRDRGELTFKEEVDCPICLETGPGVEQAFCMHALCIVCFKQCYFYDGIDPSDEEPAYPRINNGDTSNGDEEEVDLGDPRIIEYYENHRDWGNRCIKRRRMLARCPICRADTDNNNQGGKRE